MLKIKIRVDGQPGVSATPEIRSGGPRKGQQLQQWVWLSDGHPEKMFTGGLGEKHPRQGRTAKHIEEGSWTWGGRGEKDRGEGTGEMRKVWILFSGQWKVTEMF